MSHAFLFPGQGSQQVGMGRALAARFPCAREVFEQANEALGFDLAGLCFEGPEDELVLTANTQPAILTCSTAALAVVRQELGITPSVCLGHSLGEFSALVAVGALMFSDAVRLVRLRGEAMQASVAPGVGAMAAIMGVDGEALEILCAEVAQDQVVAPANENGGGQIVVAGHREAVDRLVERVKAHKGRAIPLKVSAPFHCALMQPAADRLAEALSDVSIGEMSAPVISNVDAEPNQDRARVAELLVRQVTSRVRWERSVRKILHMGVTTGLELGHGKVLAGLAKRISPDLRVFPVGSPDDIPVLKVGP